MHTHILDVAVVVIEAAATATTITTKLSHMIKAHTTFNGSEDKLDHQNQSLRVSQIVKSLSNSMF